jgi:hypothetical protein
MKILRLRLRMTLRKVILNGSEGSQIEPLPRHQRFTTVIISSAYRRPLAAPRGATSSMRCSSSGMAGEEIASPRFVQSVIPPKAGGVRAFGRRRWASTLGRSSTVQGASSFRATTDQLAKHPRSHCNFLLLRPRPHPRSPPAFISWG